MILLCSNKLKIIIERHNAQFVLLMRLQNLRFDVSLRLTQEAVRPLIQFAGGRLLYPNVTILVSLHLFAYILNDERAAGRQGDAGHKSGYKTVSRQSCE